MKKKIGALLIFLPIAVLLYLFIFSSSAFSEEKFVKMNKDGLFRNMIDIKNWPKWWPGKNNNDSPTVFSFEGNNYAIKKITTSSVSIDITGKDFSAGSLLTLIPLKYDSTKIIWTGNISPNGNPFNKIQSYFIKRKIKNDLEKLLLSISSYYNNTTAVYGFAIKNELVVDSTYVFTYLESKNKSDVTTIYKLVDKLKNYIQLFDAKETGYPMLNISTKDSSNYRVQVALPTNKKIPSSKDIFYKWMPVGGKILVLDVKGGDKSIETAMKAMETYMIDYAYQSPAMPYYSLITNRIAEPDSSKWITRIYYPAM